MPQFELTAAYKLPYGGRRWRRHPQDAVAELQSWGHLEGLIVTACMSIFDDPRCGGPTRFRIHGYRRGERDADFAQKILQLDVEYNQYRHSITVNHRWFDFSLRRVREDFEHIYVLRGLPIRDFKKPPKQPQREGTVKSVYVPEPPPDEYGCVESSGLPMLPPVEAARFQEEEHELKRRMR